MNVKKRGETPLKGKNADVKSANDLKFKAQGDEIRAPDILVLGGKKGVKTSAGAGKAAVKSAAKVGAAQIYMQALENNDYGENDVVTPIITSGRKTGENIYIAAKKTAGKARLKAEQKYLENHGAPLRTRTAFSPFKVRREQYNREVADRVTRAIKDRTVFSPVMSKPRQYGRAAVDKVTRPFRSAGASVAARARYFTAKTVKRMPKSAKAVNFIEKSSGKVAAAGKKVASGARIVLKALFDVIKASAGVLLPLVLIVAVVVIAVSGANSGGEAGNTSVLTPLSATGSMTETSFHISITSEGEDILSFTVANAAGGFLYTQGSAEGADSVTLHGHVSGEELTIEGTINGEAVALKGTIAADGSITMYGFLGDRAAAAIAGEWINPFGERKYIITSLFGPRIHPITGEFKNHDGYDLCAESGEGSPIYAASSGRVLVAGVYGGYGNCVVIDHGEGLHSLYGHMNAITVGVGEEVHAGQQVGTEGSTGLSDGPHLHFEARLNGSPVDGAEYYPQLYDNATSVWY